MIETSSNTHYPTRHHHVQTSLILPEDRDGFFVTYLSNEEELVNSEHMYLCVSSPSLHIYEVILSMWIYFNIQQHGLLNFQLHPPGL